MKKVLVSIPHIIHSSILHGALLGAGSRLGVQTFADLGGFL
jgi:hypothetical protein